MHLYPSQLLPRLIANLALKNRGSLFRGTRRSYAQIADSTTSSRVLQANRGLTSLIGSPNQTEVGNRSLVLALRDSCSCRHCVDVSTRQKLFETSSIPLNLAISQTSENADGTLTIKWENDIPGYENHETVCDGKHVSPIATRQAEGQHSKSQAISWDRSSYEKQSETLRFDYNAYLKSSTTLRDALTGLDAYGLIFLRNVPDHVDSVKRITERIGTIRTTFYGETWDVRSVPNAKNVAYTSQNLGFHMDLLYMENPPGVQFLHCKKQSIAGGESLFADTLTAIERMQHHNRQDIQTLATYPVTYQYRNDGQWYRFSRPTIEIVGYHGRQHPAAALQGNDTQTLRYGRDFSAVNWSPPFQGAQLPDIQNGLVGSTSPSFAQYCAAVAEFNKHLQNEANIWETKMEEGTCVIFDNRRVVHARRAFSGNAGERWLRGAYLDTDVFKSRLRVLST